MSTHLKVTASRRFGTLSPLRYPGGKAALAGLFADVIADLALPEPRYVEPYAGGAGAGIALLREGVVDRLVINDIDPAVHAFWRCVVDENEWLVDRVREVPLTVEEWQRQREIYKAGNEKDILNLGFAFFFLNRTNRSGVLNAGVIGGQGQDGNYKIDARFNRDTLAARLEAIGALRERITVTDLDGRTTIQKYADDPSTFMYIDPPYVQAGSQLYLNAFDRQDHVALSRVVAGVGSSHWLMTYDTAPLIESLYGDHFQCRLEISYSARYPGKAEELLVASPHVAKSIKHLRIQEELAAAAGA